MNNQAAVVFTFKSVEHILRDGGTQSWRMHPSHIGTFSYVVCARNRRHADVEGPEEHGAAFLIGKVRDVVPSTDPEVIRDTPKTGKKRYLIRMTEAATINESGFWKWGRWPTHFDDLGKLGIDPTKIKFRPIADLLAHVTATERQAATVSANSRASLPAGRWRDVIEAAKANLGAQLGVGVNDIEITVRI